MREIKFRAWYEEGRYMMLVESNDFVDKLINKVGVWRWFNELAIMQYTNLKDKNGVEIYEGDIVKFGGNKYAITFAKGGFGVERIYQTGVETIKVHEPLWNLIIVGCEVIGNIYENNDLLEG